MTLNPILEERNPQNSLYESIITSRIHFQGHHILKPNRERFAIDVIYLVNF